MRENFEIKKMLKILKLKETYERIDTHKGRLYTPQGYSRFELSNSKKTTLMKKGYDKDYVCVGRTSELNIGFILNVVHYWKDIPPVSYLAKHGPYTVIRFNHSINNEDGFIDTIRGFIDFHDLHNDMCNGFMEPEFSKYGSIVDDTLHPFLPDDFDYVNKIKVDEGCHRAVKYKVFTIGSTHIIEVEFDGTAARYDISVHSNSPHIDLYEKICTRFIYDTETRKTLKKKKKKK